MLGRTRLRCDEGNRNLPSEEPRDDLDAVLVTAGGTTYRLSLPDRETDYIQGRIAEQSSPYEPEMLHDMASRLSAGDVVVDVGANVGNHTIYLAAVAGCRVEAFEPDTSLADAIVRSARLNRLTKQVTVHPVALGAVAGAGTLVTPDRTNIGGQHVDVGTGDIPVHTLDEAGVPRPVAALKLDVEGMELDVLRGAEALVTEDRPLLYVECSSEAAFGDVASWLDERGYAYWDTFNATPTHLFLPADGIAGDRIARRLLLKTVRDGFRSAEALQRLRASLHEANLKYRSSTSSYDALRRQYTDVTARLEALQQELASARSAVDESALSAAEERARHTAASARSEAALAAARADAEQVASELRALTEHADRYRADALAAQAELKAARWTLDEVRREVAARDESLAGAEARVRELEATRDAAIAESAQRLAERADAVARLERERDEARHCLSERERQRDEARGAAREAMQERDRLKDELAGEREVVARLSREIDDTRKALRRAERASESLRSELNDVTVDVTAASEKAAQAAEVAASRAGELAAVGRELEHLRREMGAASVDLGAQRERADSLERGLRAAWTEAGELGSEAARRSSEAQRLTAALEVVRAQRDRALEIMSAATEGERAALKREAIHRRRELSAREAEAVAREMLNDLRASVTFRTGREIRRASGSFRSAVALPGRLWRLARERQEEPRRVAPPGAAGACPGDDLAEPVSAAPTPISVPDLDVLVDRGVARQETRLRIAAIVDEFTALSLEPECDLRHLSPTAWREELEAFRPQMLFVESAWRGDGGMWHNTVSLLPSELRGIVEWCQSRGVPTVFWNKEDPVHFSTFLTTARAFDHVFTTDIDCIGRYKAALGHDRVYLLPFAAQPRTHNPLEDSPRKDAISFAGSYYRRYPERTRDLDSFLEHLPGFRPVEIFDRNFGNDDPNYSFPEAYQKYVVGALPPEEIARAYKNYRYAINLNSVKQSQTMFARRVFELLASNTVTVSNFSRGLRLLFGDLVVATDSGREAVRRLSDLSANDDRLDRLRLLALRSVMSQHTYADRLAYVVARATGRTVPDLLPEVVFVGRARTQDDVDALIAAVERQEGLRHRTVLVLDAGLDRPLSAGLTVVHADAADEVPVADVAGNADLVGVMHPNDHYGPHYALDLALATRYCDAAVLGKRTRYVLDGEAVSLVDVGAEYRRAGRLPVRASLARVEAVASNTLAELCSAADDDGLYRASLQQVALDRFSYCRDAARLPHVPEADAHDSALWPGLGLAHLQRLAEAATPMEEPGRGLQSLGCDDLNTLFANSRRPSLRHELASEGWTLHSELEDGKHDYIYSDRLVPVGELWTGSVAEAYVDTSPGLRLQAVFLFLDAQGERVATMFAPAQQNASAVVPDSASVVKIGFRALGPGSVAIRRVVLGKVRTESKDIITPGGTLLLTNHYPSYDNLYRNGFVHSRVRAYRQHGLRPTVFRMRPGASLSYDEFEAVDVLTGGEEALRKLLESTQYRSVMVHFLDRPMWESLRSVGESTRVVVWVHGAEIHAWWRRAYNITTPAAEDDARATWEVRKEFWLAVFAEAGPNVHFVFVSRHFASEALGDLGVTLDASRYSVVHNPVDTSLFTYEPKPLSQRKRLLSVRPFASPQYANDLTVAALLELRKEDWFDELQVRIVGEGPLFEETVEPLRGLKNVLLERRFLPQHEIAAIHKEYGVFIVPTRWDSHGVSRDEAMSSGLAPVTTAVAAVPEFVDDGSGITCPPEDAIALADGIRRLVKDPDLFARISEGAAARVRRQSDAARIIRQELELIRGDFPSGGSAHR